MMRRTRSLARPEPEEVDESVVAAVARIMGVHSAAQQALNDAAARRQAGQTVIFATVPGSFLVIDVAGLA